MKRKHKKPFHQSQRIQKSFFQEDTLDYRRPLGVCTASVTKGVLG
ncbi:hypothetical protein VULLAG_LOCUS16044 [Vulpes lagopus]